MLLVAPAGDDLTEAMAKWALRLANKVPHIEPLIGGDASRSAVLGHLLTAGCVIIFYGHGQSDGLLLRYSHQPTPSDYLARRSDFDLTRGVQLIAYCCHAGAELGEYLASNKTCSFVGFDDEVPFELFDSDTTRAFRAPMEMLLLDVAMREPPELSDGDYDTLLRYYETQSVAWQDNTDHPRAIVVLAFLELHTQSLNRQKNTIKKVRKCSVHLER